MDDMGAVAIFKGAGHVRHRLLRHRTPAGQPFMPRSGRKHGGRARTWGGHWRGVSAAQPSQITVEAPKGSAQAPNREEQHVQKAPWAPRKRVVAGVHCMQLQGIMQRRVLLLPQGPELLREVLRMLHPLLQPLPRLQLPRPVPHASVSLPGGGARVRPRPVPQLHCDVRWQRRTRHRVPQHEAASAAAPARVHGPVDRPRLGRVPARLLQRGRLPGRVHR
mmetsp:Transcript_26639/g.79167  ORF Transcript_26639/g.79167 Transcript_26639/m.79167 type:complete len:220 (+) Transcript_26639:171-830(+)